MKFLKAPAFALVTLALSLGAAFKFNYTHFHFHVPPPYSYVHAPAEIHAGQPAVIDECLDPELEDSVGPWKIEIARRFPNSVAVFCHGADDGDRWIGSVFGVPVAVDNIAARFQLLYPDRTIVLICCNPGHYHLHVHGIYHAMTDIWIIPDREPHYGETERSLTAPDFVGNIFEFTAD